MTSGTSGELGGGGVGVSSARGVAAGDNNTCRGTCFFLIFLFDYHGQLQIDGDNLHFTTGLQDRL